MASKKTKPCQRHQSSLYKRFIGLSNGHKKTLRHNRFSKQRAVICTSIYLRYFNPETLESRVPFGNLFLNQTCCITSWARVKNTFQCSNCAIDLWQRKMPLFTFLIIHRSDSNGKLSAKIYFIY